MAQITVIHDDGSSEELKLTTKLKRTDALLMEDVVPLVFKVPTDWLGTKRLAVVSVFEGDDLIGPANDKLL